MFTRINHVVAGNADYDPIEIDAEIFPLDGESSSSLFIQQPGQPRDTKEIISVEEFQLDELIAKLIETRDEIRGIRGAEKWYR